MSVAITGVAIACASVAARPKASGSIEAIDGDVRGAEGRRHVLHVADDAHAILQPGGVDLRCQRGLVATASLRVAGEDERRHRRARPRCASSARRLDDELLALPRVRRAACRIDASLVVDAPLRAHRGDALRRDVHRIELAARRRRDR